MFMYYIKLYYYYAHIVLRFGLLVVFKPLALLFNTVVALADDWEVDKPTKPNDDDDDYYNDPNSLGIQLKQHIVSGGKHRKYSTMRYTYDILDARGNTVETGLNSETEAQTVIDIRQEQGVDTSEYTIRRVEHYTTTGLGRDPDLH